jgi:DNA (cytosine-5)-methyltransferase 1
LFSGCGGLSLGLENAGYAVLLSLDNDPWALETHRHNLPGVALDLDLSESERVDSLVRLLSGISIDLVAGGPPCQPFSRAGRSKLRSLVRDGTRSGQDARTELWQSFVTIAERLRPAAVMLENVPDMALGDDLSILRAMTTRLEEAGYDVHARLIDAWRYGVPQHRQRLILVAVRDGRPFEWPAEQKKLSLRDAIGDLPPLRGRTGEAEMRAGAPRTAFQRRAREGMSDRSVVWDHVTRPVREDDREAFRLMKPGTRYWELPEHLRRYRDDIFGDKYNRLSWDDLSRSITAHIAKDGYWYIHPSEQRTLTVREAARIQTFPDRFRFAGTRSHAFRQIGNAVPPALAEAVGRQLLEAAKRRPAPPGRRASDHVSSVRSHLLQWASRDIKQAPWRHPGSPWSALVGVLLGDRLGAQDDGAREFLERHPALSRKAFADIERERRRTSGARREALARLARAARSLSNTSRAKDANSWVEAAGLNPQEEALARTLGLREDKILASTPALRVIARLTGRPVDEERRLSDGRMEIARLVGTGMNAPKLAAALHALGRVVCTAQEPTCAKCPVSRLCSSSS